MVPGGGHQMFIDCLPDILKALVTSTVGAAAEK
jgi:hypothetical protein